MNRIPISGTTAPDGFQFSSERTVNYYPEGEKSALTPGMRLWVELGNGPIRGGCLHREELIVVSGSTVYRVGLGGTYRAVGSILKSKGVLKCISNGQQVLILNPDGCGDGFVYDGSGVKKLTDPDWVALKATSIVFHDGYAIANKPGTGQYYISGTYDFTTWNALDFATAEAKPDDLVHIESDKNLGWLFGTRTLEVIQTTGNSDFPFEPLRSAFSYFGAYAGTVQRIDNTIIWFGRNEQGGKSILALSGAADPQQISDDRINEWLDSVPLPEIQQALSFSCWYRGHAWYVLTFPTLETFGRTLVYDATAGRFFEWSTYCDSNDKHGRFRGNFQIGFAGLNIVGDSLSGALFQMDKTYHLDGVLPIKRTRRIDTMGADLEWVSYSALQAELETGEGTPGQDYTMELRFSNDRGRSWSHSIPKSIGEGGEYSKDVVWRRLGRSKRRSWEINTTAQRDHRINAIYLDVA